MLRPVAGTDRRYELYWIAVSPEGRERTKLAARLLAAARKRLREMGGVYALRGDIHSSGYEPASKFYRAQGYALKGAISDWHADGDGLAIYGKRLSDMRVFDFTNAIVREPAPSVIEGLREDCSRNAAIRRRSP